MILDGDSFRYVLKQTAETLVIMPTLAQDWEFCPNTCSFSENSSSGIDSSVVSFSPQTGAFMINSNDKTLHNVQVDLTLECRPSFNTGAVTSSFDFSFIFYDECWDTQMTPTFSSGINAPLFIENLMPYQQATSIAECGVFENSITLLNADGDMPVIELNLDANSMITVMGDNPDEHIGEHFVRIKSCISVFDQGVPTIC